MPTKSKKTSRKTAARAPRIRVTNEKREAAADTAATDAESAPKPARGELQKLSTPELRALYQDVVGRETSSDNRAYLIWKIREARSGRIRVGRSRTREPKGPQQVLSVRVDEDAVPLLDAAWRKHGMRSRNDLVLQALGYKLAALGEDDAAVRFTGQAEA